MIRIAIITVFYLIAFIPSFAQPERIIEKFMVKERIPGLFVSVVHNDTVLYNQSFGEADIKSHRPMSDNTCMELGSISKLFTAEVIYSLHHAGLLNIHDPVRKYLPEAPVSWSNISIQQLLRHTSGILNYLLDPRFKAGAYFTNQKDTIAEQFFKTTSTDEMVEMFYELPLEFRPGSNWSYSNTGYYLLGKIGEVVTGRPFFELVKNWVFDPLQMQHTMANELSANEKCLAKGYLMKDTSLEQSRVLLSNYAFSAGAWATTGQDMIQLLKAVHKQSLPSDKYGINWRKKPYGDSLPFTYEGGRFYSVFHGLNIISHNGGTPGFSSSWIYIVEKNLSIIVLMNRQDYAAIDQLAWEVLSCFEDDLKYPTKTRYGRREKSMTEKVKVFIQALKTDEPYHNALSKPLSYFLNSENGKGFWKWYFERGYPTSFRCVEVERSGDNRIYRFLLTCTRDVVYHLSILENKKGEWKQIRWW